MRIGGAEISTVHANFIINRGDRAEDFLALMERAQERVKMLFGVELKPEIQIMGEDRVRVSD
jgi:UDP-N-acetylmuramate dehydrogenase